MEVGLIVLEGAAILLGAQCRQTSLEQLDSKWVALVETVTVVLAEVMTLTVVMVV